MDHTNRATTTIHKECSRLASGSSLKLGKRMLLTIRAARLRTNANHTMDQRQSSIGYFQACTVAATIPAAAGQGMPRKYRSPLPEAMPCTLKRAKRQAQQIVKARLTTQATCEM